MIRVLKTSFAVLATMAVVAAALTLAPAEADEAQAASAWDFDAGYIISDANFYDSNSMTAGDVQSFLNARVPNCEPWRDSNPRDVTCLKDYSTQTTAKPADTYCSGYPSQRQTAAQIIDGVARSCGISQKVLLVTLQKENALVNHTWPSSWRYQTAMGYGCPDNAACDTQYYGLFNQIYRAAWQFKYYAAHPNSYAYRAGQNNYVQWNPNAACGGSTVYIRNQATASLYIYTPYQPNNAAKNAGYGSGDDCSSYGNRNFFLWYSDWFGSPAGYATSGAIGAKYTALGRERSYLGPAASAEGSGLRGGGAYQVFVGGQIHWSPATGAHATKRGSAIQSFWAGLSWENGPLGYPTSDEIVGLRDNGASQVFQNGQVHWSPQTPARMTRGAIQDRWASSGWESGQVGYPVSNETTGLKDGGATQQFQYGRITWSPQTGPWITRGAIGDLWGEIGREESTLRYPTSPEYTNLSNGGSAQVYQGGQVHWSPTTGAHLTRGAILTAWAGTGYERGLLGYPVAEEQTGLSAGGALQRFQNGLYTWSPQSGAHSVHGGIGDAWAAAGGAQGKLGYPVSEETSSPSGARQQFQNGSIAWNATNNTTSIALS
ncbi:hypothetical protein F8O06_00075 [Pseudoclavibacter sp. CFCC 14310]|uniref:hypothetical protein n=1 Tax=Pseudoclavibacter sp. CFCC 14310 TaxID=2615180 RepID=UPI0013018EA0|nr:hypothetical protein [Pseudoclavibacter sp. CFCC 14310]KAB1647028.1 hypothetical protein F8O06_00075 [Pseudoclavibacter sp. CFCC 14310]